MPVPLARPVSLSPAEHTQLESLVRAHSTPQALAFRCRLILRSAAPDRPSHVQVATEMDCERHTVGRWRHRYLTHGLNGLQCAARGSPAALFPPLNGWMCCRWRPGNRPRIIVPPAGGVSTIWSRLS